MADNYVAIKITADDGAKPDLTELKAKLDELGVKVATARADVDDAAADAKLTDLEAKLAAVGKKVASPRIDVAGAARALAQLTAVDAAMDDLKAKADRESAESGGEGVLGRFFMGKSGSSGSGFLGGALTKLPLIGEQLSGIAESLAQGGGGEGEEGGGMVESLGSVAGSGAGIAVVGGVVGALVTEVAALATGLTAAGLGVGSFAVLALPAIKAVSGAYTQINADQTAYNRALTATARNTALAHLKQDYASLTPAQRGAVGGLQQLVGEYHKLSKAFEPTAFKVFNEGLKIANQLLPYVGKFADAAAPAIEGLLGGLSKGLDSAAFKKFAGFLESLSGPVITAIGSGMAGLAGDVMTLMEQFSKKDVLNSVHIAFRLIGAALSALIWTVKISMGAWDLLTDAVRRTMTAFDIVRHAVAEAGHDIASAFDEVRHKIAGIADGIWHDVTAAFDKVRSAVTGAVDAMVGYVRAHWKLLAAIFLGPLGLVIDALATHWSAVEHGFESAYKFVAGIVSKGIDFIKGVIAPYVKWSEKIFSAGWDAVKAVFRAAWGFIVPYVQTAVLGVKTALSWFGKLAGLFRGWWDDAARAVESGIGKLVGFVRRLPGMVNSALGGLPGMMFRAGIHAIENLIDGITSQIGHLGSVMGGIASKVAGFFGLSPAKEGPLSGGGAPYIRGQHFVADIRQGITSGVPGLSATMAKVAGTVAGGTGRAGGSGAYGAGGRQQLEVLLTMQNNPLLRAMQATVRQAGGDPLMFQKKVQYR